MGLYHLLERKAAGHAQATKYPANLRCLLTLNNSKALGANNYWNKTPDTPASAFGLCSSCKNTAQPHCCSSCCRLCKPSCLALLGKPLNFSSPSTNDDQQANDYHSPQQDLGNPFNKCLPLQLKQSFMGRNMFSCASVWQKTTWTALSLKCGIIIGRLIVKKYHVLLQFGKHFV